MAGKRRTSHDATVKERTSTDVAIKEQPRDDTAGMPSKKKRRKTAGQVRDKTAASEPTSCPTTAAVATVPSEKALKAREYLQAWSQSRSTWKFSKKIQAWILANLFSAPQELFLRDKPDFAVALEYLENLSGGARALTLKMASDVAKEPSPLAFEQEESVSLEGLLARRERLHRADDGNIGDVNEDKLSTGGVSDEIMDRLEKELETGSPEGAETIASKRKEKIERINAAIAKVKARRALLEQREGEHQWRVRRARNIVGVLA